MATGGPGTAIQKTSSTTFANVSLTPNVPTIVTLADATVISINTDSGQQFNQTNTQAEGSLTINNPTGTPSGGQKFIVRINSANSQNLTFGSVFRASNDFSFPATTTGSSKNDYLGFIYNATDARWDLLAKVFGF